METHLKIVGALMVALGLMHIGIPRFFAWKQELLPLTIITRQILYVHTFFIAFTVSLMGILCLMYSHELSTDPFGKVISLGLFIFWFTRLVFQFFVYSSEVWRGKRFETTMHVLFSVLWCYFSLTFFLSWRM